MYLGETKHMTVTIRLGDFYVCKIEMVIKLGQSRTKSLMIILTVTVVPPYWISK